MTLLSRTVIILTWVALLWVPTAEANHTKVYVRPLGIGIRMWPK